MSKSRLTLLAFALAALAGCADNNAASRLQLGVYGQEDVLRPLLTVTAVAGSWSVELAGSEIGTADNDHRSREYDTPRDGTLRVTAVLARPGEAPLATVTRTLDIREDWIWGVDVHLGEGNPTDLCFGCMGHEVVAVPDSLIPGAADSLYLVWGGNSVSHPVIY